MNVYKYPFKVAIVNDGVIKTGLTWENNHGGRFEVVVFLNTPFERRTRVRVNGVSHTQTVVVEMKHRMEIVPVGIADAMVNPIRVMGLLEFRALMNDVVINPYRPFLTMFLEAFDDKITEAIAHDYCRRAMAKKISRVWKRVNNDPNHQACRHRLMREFAEMV